MADWKTLSSRIAYENPFMFVREDQAINPAGNQTIYGVVESKSAAVYIVPVDKDGNTFIIKQFRYPTQKIAWDCIAGRTDNEDPIIAAKRELHEEAGIHAEKITILRDVAIGNGITTFHGTICLAEELTHTDDERDAEEGILEVQKISFVDVIDMIVKGEIQSTESIAAFFITREYLQQKGLHGSTHN